MIDRYLTFVTHPLLLIALAMLAVFLVLQNLPASGVTIKPLRFHKKRGLNALGWFAVVLLPIWIAILILTVYSLFSLWAHPPNPVNENSSLAYRVHYLAIVGLMTGLAGLVGTPLALIRVFATERSTAAAEEGLITERINKAVEGLGSEKTVRSVVETPRYKTDEHGDWLKDENGDPIPALRPDKRPIVDRATYERTEPNIEVRIGAIYALERIAQDSQRDHIQIMEILCAYIRENSKLSSVQEYPELPWGTLNNPSIKDATAYHMDRLKKRFGNHVTESLAFKWATRLAPPRVDIGIALEVIGRRSSAQMGFERVAPVRRSVVGYFLDLRKSNLQGCDLSNLDFQGANFSGSKLDGANLSGAYLEGAKFSGASLIGTRLSSASLEKADFTNAKMESAEMDNATLTGATAFSAKMNGAEFYRADLTNMRFEYAELEAANFNEAIMAGADLRDTKLIGSLNLDNAKLHGAGFKNTQIPVMEYPERLQVSFGDGSVRLQEDLEAGRTPFDHWPSEDLFILHFYERWRAWQAEIGYSPPNR